MYISHSVMEGQRHNNPLNPRCFCLQRPKRDGTKMCIYKNNLLSHVIHAVMSGSASVVQEKRSFPVIVVRLQNVPCAAVRAHVPHVNRLLSRTSYNARLDSHQSFNQCFFSFKYHFSFTLTFSFSFRFHFRFSFASMDAGRHIHH